MFSINGMMCLHVWTATRGCCPQVPHLSQQETVALVISTSHFLWPFSDGFWASNLSGKACRLKSGWWVSFWIRMLVWWGSNWLWWIYSSYHIVPRSFVDTFQLGSEVFLAHHTVPQCVHVVHWLHVSKEWYNVHVTKNIDRDERPSPRP